jgi:hypothetical protein
MRAPGACGAPAETVPDARTSNGDMDYFAKNPVRAGLDIRYGDDTNAFA